MAEALVLKRLWEPILDQGIPNTHFFNGRILTAGDLKNEQEAESQHRWQLGQAIGAGAVRGLEVGLISDGSDDKAPILSVTSGLALNCNGEAIALPYDVQVALEDKSQSLPVEAGLFKECLPPKKSVSPTPAGVYMLLASPASGFSEEKAPMWSSIDKGKVVGCGSRYAIEGVQFRLEELKLSLLTGLSPSTRDALADLTSKKDPASLSKLRNWLAHVCLGTEEVTRFLRDPFARISEQTLRTSPFLSYGALDAMRASGNLTCCDVPLALMHWPKGGVQFVDMWSVRRRPFSRPRSSAWPLPLSDRRQAEAEAAFHQFESQAEDLLRSKLSDGVLSALKATDYFRYLPAAGILPLAGKKGSRGVNLMNFTSGLTLRDRGALQVLPVPDRVFIEGAKLERLTRDSLAYPPIDLNSGELIWFYLVRENIQAIDKAAFNPPQPYLLFANGQIPFMGDARFDLNYWEYSNYA
jgi:hypothetical protein